MFSKQSFYLLKLRIIIECQYLGFFLFAGVLPVTQTSLPILTANFLTLMFGCLFFLFGHAICVPGIGVLGCVSAGVPVDGVFPGDPI